MFGKCVILVRFSVLDSFDLHQNYALCLAKSTCIIFIVSLQVSDHVLAGIESIVGQAGSHYFKVK